MILREIFKNPFNSGQRDMWTIWQIYDKIEKKSTVDERITIQKEYDGTLSYVSKRYALKAQDKLNAKEKKKRNDARFDKC